MTVIVASGITLFEESATVPASELELVCAATVIANSNVAAIAQPEALLSLINIDQDALSRPDSFIIRL
jgi:hypothetical protein